jgi:hypothetical protein
MVEQSGANISRRKLAKRHDVSVRSIERRQASDPRACPQLRRMIAETS